MNDLYLIGNGFDLAHGLEASYNHFLLWYLNLSVQNCNLNGSFKDNLVKINRNGYCYTNLENFGSVEECLREMKRMDFAIKYNHDFLKNLVENYREYKWVDIEYEYYWTLVQIVKAAEKNVYQRDIYLDMVRSLNFCFVSIKKKLVEYLLSVKISSGLKYYQIEKILFEPTGEDPESIANAAERMIGNTQEKIFVCFNYTSTMDLYLRNSTYKNNLIYIHGELDGTSNPIIFGYGDEMDPHYEKIEDLNQNEFLKNIKSFDYFKTDNYQRVIRFVESSDFTVKILGHSCGLSDRILLNTIFEHKNCKKIKIYHYDKSEKENDYFEKTQEISRHFKASMKGDMRMKIVPFNKYNSMPQNPKK